MNKIHFSIILLGTVTAALLISGNQQASATEINNNVSQKTIESLDTTKIISYKAADLQPESNSIVNLKNTQAALDLDKFCKDFPLNSRCENRPVKVEVQPEVQIKAPKQETQSTKSGWAVKGEAGTLGAGVSVTNSLAPNLNARLGVTGFSTDLGERTIKNVNVKGKLNLFNVTTGLDYYPIKGSGFHVTGGLVFNNGNNADLTAKPSASASTIQIDGKTYSVDALRNVKAKVPLTNAAAPYLGIGWGNPVRDNENLEVSLNLGLVFRGKPSVQVTPEYGPDADNIPGLKDEINTSIANYKKDIQDGLDKLPVYPVLSVGVSYQF